MTVIGCVLWNFITKYSEFRHWVTTAARLLVCVCVMCWCSGYCAMWMTSRCYHCQTDVRPTRICPPGESRDQSRDRRRFGHACDAPDCVGHSQHQHQQYHQGRRTHYIRGRVRYHTEVRGHRLSSHSQCADSIGHGGHLPHFYKWPGTGAPWVEEQQSRNWPNCTDHPESAHQTTNWFYL